MQPSFECLIIIAGDVCRWPAAVAHVHYLNDCKPSICTCGPRPLQRESLVELLPLPWMTIIIIYAKTAQYFSYSVLFQGQTGEKYATLSSASN